MITLGNLIHIIKAGNRWTASYSNGQQGEPTWIAVVLAKLFKQGTHWFDQEAMPASILDQSIPDRITSYAIIGANFYKVRARLLLDSVCEECHQIEMGTFPAILED